MTDRLCSTYAFRDDVVKLNGLKRARQYLMGLCSRREGRKQVLSRVDGAVNCNQFLILVAAIPFLYACVILTLAGCVSSSRYFSGQTLDEGKTGITVGADDISVQRQDKTRQDKTRQDKTRQDKILTISKANPIAPSLGAAAGCR